MFFGEAAARHLTPVILELGGDAERHRLTAGITFLVANKLFPTDLRLNYEKYWYPNHGVPKESEQDKLVAELMIRF